MASRKIEVQIVGDARQLARTFDKAGKSAEGFGSRLGRASRRIGLGIAGIASTAGTLGVVSVRSFALFEESLDRIVGLAGGSREQVKKFGDEILKLGPTVGKSPQELAEALYFVASAGIAVSKQMGVVRVSAKASAAGLGETQVVADAVTSAMNAYGSSALSAQKATDVLAATVREGKGEASAFAPVIGTVASIASNLGVSFNEVGAALAAMTRLGIPAEVASVQLQAVFSSLLKDTPKTAKALASVGLSHAGLRKELKEKGLLAMLTTLKERFGDNTAAMAQAFPNIRALRGLLALVGKNAEDVRGVFGRMVDSTGALETAFGAVSEGTAFKFKQAMAALAATGIRFGAALAPLAKILADELTKALTALSPFIKQLSVWANKTENQKRVQEALVSVLRAGRSVFEGMRAVIVPLAQAAASLTERLGGLRRTVELLLIAMVAGKVFSFAAAITGLGTSALATTGKVNSLRFALLRLGAIGLIVLGVEVILNKDKIDNAVRGPGGLLDKLHVGFLKGGGSIELPVGINAAQLQVVRDRLAGIKGEGDIVVKAFDKAIQKLTELGRTGFPKRPEEGRGARDAAKARERGDAAEKATKDVGRTAEQRGAAVAAAAAAAEKATADAAAKVEAAAAKAEAARQRQEEAFARLLDGLNLNLEKAQATAKLGDDLRALGKIEEAIKARIRAEGRTVALERQLFQVRQQAAETRARQRDTKQFALLGLGPGGEEKIPGVKALRGQLGRITDAIKGTFLDTGKTKSLLQNIRKILSGQLGVLSGEVRGKIKDLLADLNQQLRAQDKVGQKLTKHRIVDPNKILQGVGLSPEQQRQLRARLISQSSGGGFRTEAGQGAFGFTVSGGGVVINGPITVVADNPDAFMRELGKRGRRAVKSRSGRFAGNRGL